VPPDGPFLDPRIAPLRSELPAIYLLPSVGVAGFVIDQRGPCAVSSIEIPSAVNPSRIASDAAKSLRSRAAARDRKDFTASDQIRDGLIALGISIEDTAQGPRWSITSNTTPTEGSE